MMLYSKTNNRKIVYFFNCHFVSKNGSILEENESIV